MVWLPELSAAVVNVTIPLAPTLPVPTAVPPSLNVTVPVGVPDPLATATVAVNVTACPGVLGFGDAVNVVVVVPCLTVCVNETGWPALKFVSPA
jgi:hypothetical protein